MQSMGEWSSRFILAFLLLASATVNFRCAKSSEDGGQVGGGGFVKVSSEDEVKSALTQALKLASDPDVTRNVIVEYWKSRGKDGTNPQIKIPTHIFPNAQYSILIDDARFDSPALNAIGQKKPQFLKSGNCRLGPGETSTDASVSSYTLDGEVCFSIGNLRRIPPNDLLRHLLALVLHEAAHLGGADEAEARAWQDDFEKYFGFRFGDISKGAVEIKTRDAIQQAKDLLQKALVLAEENPNDPQIYNFVGRFSERLSRLPDIDDQVALVIKLKPQHPELVGNYVNSILAVLEKVQIKFETPTQIIHAGGLSVPISFMSPELVKPAIVDLVKNLRAIEGNFKAFMDDSMAPYSRCVLPEGKIDPADLFQNLDKKIFSFPARNCRVLEFKPINIQTE